MSSKNIEIIIAFLIKLLHKYQYPISSIRIQKLLYLIDYFFYKRYGRTLTGLKWKFHLYGPYSQSLAKVIGEEFAPFDYRTFLTKEVSSKDLGPDEKEIVYYVTSHFGNSNLGELLDFVYFHTEPMKHTKRGKFLDFSVIEPQEKVLIPVEKVYELRKAIKRFKQAVDKLNWDVNPEPVEIEEDLNELSEADLNFPHHYRYFLKKE